MRPLALALLTLLLPAALAAQGQATLEDGPYVFWHGSQAQVLRVHQAKLEQCELGRSLLLPLDGLPPLLLDPMPPQPAETALPMPERIAAVSDIHGNCRGVTALLQAQGIIDRNRRWTFGKGHLVVIGDTFDRGAEVTEAFWLLRSLEAQAKAAGGRVHVLLGNHEVRALRGDTAYLNGKYLPLIKITGMDQAARYGPDSDQGRWLRTRNVVLRLGDLLFLHAGLHPDFATHPMPLAEINAGFRSGLDAAIAPPLLGRDGPSYYRGLIPGKSQNGDASDAEVTAILAAYHAKAFVVGHSTLKQIATFHDGRVTGVDADLQSGKPGEVWLWEKGQPFRGLADGTRVALPRWDRPGI